MNPVSASPDSGAPRPQPGRAVASPRLPLRRPENSRVLAGVCAGIALHLSVRTSAVRWVFIILGLLGGVGFGAYVFLWLTVPSGDPVLAARQEADPARSRAVPPPEDPLKRATRTLSKLPLKDIAFGIILLVIALLLLTVQWGWSVDTTWLIPALIVTAGAFLAWSQVDSRQRGRLLAQAGGRTPIGVVRLAGGLGLVVLGVLLLVGQDATPQTLVKSTVAALAVLAGAALVLAPWWLRLISDLGAERAARERADVRADIAAHLHDSVLQTLALIQHSADNQADVVRLARTQERELREWLYEDRPETGTSLATELKDLVAGVEDELAPAQPIDAVIVGDIHPTPETTALLQATREALLNAVRHGAPPVSLYLEATPALVDVFVKDRGSGFDIDSIPADRWGVRESMMGRVNRRGGTVTLRSSGEGTEVHLSIEPHGTANTQETS